MAIGSFVYKDGEEFLGASNEGISKLIFDEDAFAPLPLEFSQRTLFFGGWHDERALRLGRDV